MEHYVLHGLRSGEKGSKLWEKDVSKALELRGDPNAHENFEQNNTPNGLSKDERAREIFDDFLKVKRDQKRCRSQRVSRKRNMLEQRGSFAPDPTARERAEVSRLRVMNTNQASASASVSDTEDKHNSLKVPWNRIGEDCSAGRLENLFSRFDRVDNVFTKKIIKNKRKKKRLSALVVMATKEKIAEDFSYYRVALERSEEQVRELSARLASTEEALRDTEESLQSSEAIFRARGAALVRSLRRALVAGKHFQSIAASNLVEKDALAVELANRTKQVSRLLETGDDLRSRVRSLKVKLGYSPSHQFAAEKGIQRIRSESLLRGFQIAFEQLRLPREQRLYGSPEAYARELGLVGSLASV